MNSTKAGFSIVIPLPSKEPCFAEYLALCEMINQPPLLLIMNFILFCNNANSGVTLEDTYDRIDFELTQRLYDQLETESHETFYDPYKEIGKGIVTEYMEELDRSPEALRKYREMVGALAEKFMLLYQHIPLPEEFYNLDPFYELSLNMLGDDAAVVVITEKDDVGALHELFQRVDV